MKAADGLKPSAFLLEHSMAKVDPKLVDRVRRMSTLMGPKRLASELNVSRASIRRLAIGFGVSNSFADSVAEKLYELEKKMGYFKDLDEQYEDRLVDELFTRFRNRVLDQCDYCGRTLDTAPCKENHRHKDQPLISDHLLNLARTLVKVADAPHPKLEALLELTRTHRMTPEELERQRRSFAFGNVAIDNPNVTKEMVDAAAERLKAGEG